MSELDKLEAYLREGGYYYRRFDGPTDRWDLDRHQIIVYNDGRYTEESMSWDAVCHIGSYGYEEGLLEIMGDIVNEAEVGDRVEGYLTAEDVMKRVREKELAKMRAASMRRYKNGTKATT